VKFRVVIVKDDVVYAFLGNNIVAIKKTTCAYCIAN
jgi:hypothetical protein